MQTLPLVALLCHKMKHKLLSMNAIKMAKKFQVLPMVISQIKVINFGLKTGQRQQETMLMENCSNMNSNQDKQLSLFS